MDDRIKVQGVQDYEHVALMKRWSEEGGVLISVMDERYNEFSQCMLDKPGALRVAAYILKGLEEN